MNGGCTLYILQCADGSYYVGTTRLPIDARLSEHQDGVDQKSFTASRRPVNLVYSAHYELITDAIAAERQIKGWRREKKEALIKGDFDLLPALARRYGKR